MIIPSPFHSKGFLFVADEGEISNLDLIENIDKIVQLMDVLTNNQEADVEIKSGKSKLGIVIYLSTP